MERAPDYEAHPQHRCEADRTCQPQALLGDLQRLLIGAAEHQCSSKVGIAKRLRPVVLDLQTDSTGNACDTDSCLKLAIIRPGIRYLAETIRFHRTISQDTVQCPRFLAKHLRFLPVAEEQVCVGDGVETA